jgi:hypothetical protein
MDTFKEFLAEIEKIALSINWNKSGLRGTFDNHGVTYRIEFTSHLKKKRVWSVKFFRLDGDVWSVDLFGDQHYVGNVVTTIRRAVTTFMLENYVNVILCYNVLIIIEDNISD